MRLLRACGFLDHTLLVLATYDLKETDYLPSAHPVIYMIGQTGSLQETLPSKGDVSETHSSHWFTAILRSNRTFVTRSSRSGGWEIFLD